MLHSTTRALRLSLTAATRSTSATQVCRYSKTNTASYASASGSASAKPASNSHSKRAAKIKPGVPTILLDNRCAFVRTWDFLRNPAEALALIRAVEQKYGPVESFSFQKDFDSPSMYQAHVKITFRSIDSFLRVPEDFETLHIRAPKVEPKRPGGIGLDEIHDLVSEDVEFLTADQVSEIASEERTIDFRIERAQRAYFEESPYRFTGLNQTYRKEIGVKMLEWGGFHEMKPIESTRPITNEELTDGSLDHVHMRRVLREWAEYLGVRNPHEVDPEESRVQTETTAGTEESIPTAVESKRKPEPVPPPDEWLSSDVPPPKAETIREPIEQILEMEDIKATATVTVGTGEEAQTGETSLEELVSSVSDASPTLPPEEPTQPAASALGPTPVPTEPQHEPPPLPGHSKPFELYVPEAAAAQPSSPASAPLKPQKSKVDREELEAQLQEAKRLGDLVRSSKKRRNTRVAEKKLENETTTQESEEVQPKEEVKEVKREESNSSDLEPNPRFGNFFDRIQEIFKKS